MKNFVHFSKFQSVFYFDNYHTLKIEIGGDAKDHQTNLSVMCTKKQLSFKC